MADQTTPPIFPLSPARRQAIQRTMARVDELMGVQPGRSGWTPEHIAFADNSIREAEDERFLATILALSKADKLT